MICDLFFYNEHFGGDTKIPAEAFPLWERRAEAELLLLTSGRKPLAEEEKAKMCVCEIAEYLFDVASRRGIESENNDGYSVSYQNRDIKTDIVNIVKTYLGGTDLLYRGVENAGKL